MWSVAAAVGGPGAEHFRHHVQFCWTACCRWLRKMSWPLLGISCTFLIRGKGAALWASFLGKLTVNFKNSELYLLCTFPSLDCGGQGDRVKIIILKRHLWKQRGHQGHFQAPEELVSWSSPHIFSTVVWVSLPDLSFSVFSRAWAHSFTFTCKIHSG